MSRFFVSAEAVDLKNGRITITGEDVKHIKNVLRGAPGDRLHLSDGMGVDYEVVIDIIEKDSITARIVKAEDNATEAPIHITLFQGIPKADKMEYIIQKCVELGVKRIVPVMTERTVVKLDNPRDAASKTARWKRIALEAAKQCDRGVVPIVDEPVRLEAALKLAQDCDLRLLPYEEEIMGNLRQYITKSEAAGKISSIALFIGPEGGFCPDEVEKAVEMGFKSVSLGPRILRTETAGAAVIAIIMYELGDFD